MRSDPVQHSERPPSLSTVNSSLERPISPLQTNLNRSTARHPPMKRTASGLEVSRSSPLADRDRTHGSFPPYNSHHRSIRATTDHSELSETGVANTRTSSAASPATISKRNTEADTSAQSTTPRPNASTTAATSIPNPADSTDVSAQINATMLGTSGSIQDWNIEGNTSSGIANHAKVDFSKAEPTHDVISTTSEALSFIRDGAVAKAGLSSFIPDRDTGHEILNRLKHNIEAEATVDKQVVKPNPMPTTKTKFKPTKVQAVLCDSCNIRRVPWNPLGSFCKECKGQATSNRPSLPVVATSTTDPAVPREKDCEYFANKKDVSP